MSHSELLRYREASFFFLHTHKSKASYLVNEPKLLQRATLLTYPEELKKKDKS